MRAFFVLFALLCSPLAHAQSTPFPLYVIEGASGLSGGGMAAGDIDQNGRMDLYISGLTPTGTPAASLLEFVRERIEIFPRGVVFYLEMAQKNQNVAPMVLGKAVMDDLLQTGNTELLIMGASEVDAPFSPLTALYARDPSSTLLRNVDTGLPALYNNATAIGDRFIVVGGNTGTDLLTRLYTLPTFGLIADLPAVEVPAFAWGDCDADGDLDLAYSGLDAAGLPRFYLYRNTGGTFAAVSTTVAPAFSGAMAFEDLDGDGAAELFTSGFTYGPDFVEGMTRVYDNTGDCGFTPSAIALPQVGGGTLAFGDYNNDGRNDLLLVGLEASLFDLQSWVYVYSQEADGSFVQRTRQAGTLFGDTQWYDVNADGWLDIVSVGSNEAGTSTMRVLRNPFGPQ